MKKLSTILCTLALLFIGVGGVNSVKAEKKYLEFETPWYCNASWKAESNTFSWGKNEGEWIFMTAKDVSGDLTSWTKLHMRVSNWDNASAKNLKVVFQEYTGNTPPNGASANEVLSPDENDVIELDLTTFDWGACPKTNINDMSIYGCAKDDASKEASVKVTDAYLYRPTTPEFDATGTATLGHVEFLASDGLSIDENGVVKTDGTSGKLTITFKDPVDLSALKSFTVNTSGNDFIWRTIVRKADGTDVGLWYSSKFGFSFSASQAANATDVKSIIIESNSCPAKGNEEEQSEYENRLAEFKAQTLTISNIVMKLYPVTTLSYNSLGVASINLSKIDVDGDGVSYDPETHIVKSEGNSGSFIVFLNKADFTHVTKITVSVTTSGKENEGLENEITFSDITGTSEVHDGVNNNLNTWYGSRYNMNLAEEGKGYQAKAGQIRLIKWNINQAGSMKINNITITSDEAMSIVSHNKNSLNNVTTWAKWTDVSSTATVAQTADHTWDVGKATGTVYGDPNVNYLYYADLRNYKAMKIYINESSGLVRAMFNRETDGGSYFNVQCNRSDGSLTEPNYSSYANGVFTVNLAKILADKRVVHLNAIKAQAGGSDANVDKVELITVAEDTYDYVLSGQYTSEIDISDIASNDYAKAIDCSGLHGSNLNITSANPNCLFVAGNGVLSNTNNVITSDACAQLALADGYPFKAPVAFTATAAPTYSRAFTASTTTTVCLPFALTAAEASSLGTFYELSSFDGSTLNFTSVDAPEANTPYIVMPTATALTMSETDKSIVVTPASLGTGATIDNIEFIGTLDATTIPASDGDYSYFAYNNGGLVKITTKAATLPAFRGYFKVTTSAISGARSLNISFDDETTGVKTINRESFAVDQYYDLQGRRVAQPTKGLYIVNGKKVIK